MSHDPHASWGDRTPLSDDAGVVVVFSLADSIRSGRPWADGVWRPTDVDLDRAVAMVRTALAGHTVSTSDEELADALLASGASPVRHAHTMTHDLTTVPAAGEESPIVIASLDAAGLHAEADTLGTIAFAAYAGAHPDHEHDHPEQSIGEMHAIADGEVLGPLLPVSTIARVEGRPIGACLVVERPGSAPDGGPWVVDVFRDPTVAVRGAGTALLGGSLHRAAASGLPSLSLVVSHANLSAMRVYERLGFVETGQSRTVVLPLKTDREQ